MAQNFQKLSLVEETKETTSSIMFTPVESAIGGMMIGLSAALSYMVDGKIAGIAGLLGPFLRGVTQCQPLSGGQLWKLLFLIGLMIGGLIAMIFNEFFFLPRCCTFSYCTLHCCRHLCWDRHSGRSRLHEWSWHLRLA